MIDAYYLGNFLKQEIENAIRNETSFMQTQIYDLVTQVTVLSTMANLSIGPQGNTGLQGPQGPPGPPGEIPKLTLPNGVEVTFEELGEMHIELLSRVEDLTLQMEELLEKKEENQ